MTHSDDNKVEGLVLVSRTSKPYLNPIQEESYRDHRRRIATWLLHMGKDPTKAEGYAYATAQKVLWRLDKFYRFVWDEEGGYTTHVTPVHADEWMRHLAHQDFVPSYKSDCQKAVKILFKWQTVTQGETVEWDPVITYSDDSGTHAPRDYLTRQERKGLREAALQYGMIPAYNAVTPRERDQWKAYLAQRLGKPKTEVSKQDWADANSYKFPSLVWTTLDAGLRPIEVSRARVSWVDLDNGVLRIPREESSKNKGDWIVSLLDETVGFLEKWLAERATHPKYEGRDELWLTRMENPYGSQALNRTLEKLCEIAEIDTSDRKLSWYSIRHSTGTYMTHERDLKAAQAQLRHKSPMTTMKYDQAPVEDRKEALDRMG